MKMSGLNFNYNVIFIIGFLVINISSLTAEQYSPHQSSPLVSSENNQGNLTKVLEEKLHEEEYQLFKNPLQAISLLEDKIAEKSLNNEEQFESHAALIELYFKTEQYLKAERVFVDLQKRFSHEKKYLPKLALISAHIQLYNQATSNFLETLAPYLNVYQNDDYSELNICYLYLLGSYQITQQDFTQALNNLTQALEKAKQHNSTHLILGIQNKLVKLFYYTKDYQQALKLSDDTILQAQKINDKFAEVAALSNKMNIYYMQAVDFADKAGDAGFANQTEYKNYINQSNNAQELVIHLAQQINAYQSMVRALIMKQNQRFSSNDFAGVILVGQQIVTLSEEHNLQKEPAVASNNMAIAYRQLEQYQQSIAALEYAEKYYQKTDDFQSLIWIYEDFAKTYEMANNLPQALNYFKKYHSASTEYLSNTKKQSLLELQQKYAATERTQEIYRLTQQSALAEQQLQTEKMGRWLLIVVLLATCLIVFVLYQKRSNLKRLLKKEAKLNQQILEINQAKQRFFSNISHEFRTALTLSIAPLKSFLSANSQAQLEPIESALENNLHMMTLLNEVLDIEKLDANVLPMNISEIDINNAINSCLTRFQLQFKQKNICIKMKGFENQEKLYFDASHFEKIIANILSNAAKYCTEQCTIHLERIDDENHLELVICDNGPGIHAAELPYIYNRFYQGKSSTEKCQPGTGIGLSMVKELIELHMGEIKIFSDDGKGCCVKLTFNKGHSHYPKALLISSKEHQQNAEIHNANANNYCLPDQSDTLNIEAEEEAKTETEIQTNSSLNFSQQPSYSTQRKVIMVVDDNIKMRHLIRNILQSDYQVVEAENGEQALKMAESIQPDLVISDVMMPLMNGFQLTEKIRKNKQIAHLSIMLLTALSETEQRVHGLELGADDYITKPFDSDELKARVKNHLTHKQRLSEQLLKKYQHLLNEETPAPKFEANDSKKSKQLDAIIAENLGKYEFDIEQMYTSLNMTRSSLYRYTQKVYGCSPKNLLKKRRLELAYQMLKDYKGTISEIAYAVGYQSLSAFSRAFSEYFEHPPTKMKSIQSVR